MSKHSDLYNQVREEIARWPQWKINAYNEMFATSAHAEKVTPHTQTNADRIRSMNDEELAKEMLFFVPSDFKKHYTGLSGGYFATADEAIQASLDWLKQPAKEEHYEDD